MKLKWLDRLLADMRELFSGIEAARDSASTTEIQEDLESAVKELRTVYAAVFRAAIKQASIKTG